MVTWLLVAAAACAAMFLLWEYGKRPHTHKRVPLSNIPKFLDALLRRGYNGGFLRIDVPRTDLFLQFTKYIREGGKTGLQMDYPLAQWSESYYRAVVQLVDTLGLPYVTEATKDGAVREFLTVDFGTNIEAAADLANRITRDVYGCTSSNSLNAILSGVTAREGLE